MSLLELEQQIATTYFSPQGEVFINHNGDKELNPARMYLAGLDYPETEKAELEKLVDQVLTPDGRLIPQQMGIDLLAIPPMELNQLLKAKLWPFYNLVDYSLAPLRPGGFNLHGESHADWVADKTYQFLLASGIDDPSFLSAAIYAALLHDAGNFCSRKYHGYLAPEVTGRVLPFTTADPDLLQSTNQAMVLHDLLTADTSLQAFKVNLSSLEGIDFMKAKGDITCALILADKTHVDRSRVCKKPYDVNTFDIDNHTYINLLAHTQSVGYSESDRTFYWALQYTPGMTPEEIATYSHFARKRSHHDGYRALVPNAIHRVHREHGISHFDLWKKEFWHEYLTGIKVAVTAAFALFPELEQFKIIMKDEKIVGASYDIEKKDLEDLPDQIKIGNFQKEQRR